MQNVYTVRQINAYIHSMFTQDVVLRNLYMKGEVSNCKYHTSGHIYFSLKDESGSISCVMFASARKGLAFGMKNGQQVIVLGNINVYERDGTYQLYAAQILLDGAGLLYEKFEALKAELEEMGMFDPLYKKPIPRFIKKLGVVTAPTGAAVRDIIQISKRRNPGIEIVLCPALVQGDGAARSVAKGIAMLDAYGVDVIIAGRGGGSMEDLWAFNEEETARAIFQCETPVISAVGHETDTTMADYVADLRAPTPSAAAELAVVDIAALQTEFFRQKLRLTESMMRKLEEKRQETARRARLLKLLDPKTKMQDSRHRLLDAQGRMEKAMQEKLMQYQAQVEAYRTALDTGMRQHQEDIRHRMSLYIEKLKGLSPLEKLGQGYAYASHPDGRKIMQTADVSVGDRICVYVSDGRFSAVVSEIEKESKR